MLQLLLHLHGMKKLKVPRYIRWIVQCGLLFLVVMSLLRWLLVSIFHNASDKQTSLRDAYILGIRFDLRDVCIAMMVLFIIGSIPALHPFNKRLGKRIAFIIWTIFILTFCIFYAIDFGNYSYLHQRMNASLLNYTADASISMKMMWQTYHLGWNILILIVVTLTLLWLIEYFYRRIEKEPVVSSKTSRISWGTAFVILVTWGVMGRLVLRAGEFPLRWSDAFDLKNDYAANIALNPFQAFFSTLTFRHSTYDEKKVKEHYAWMSDYLHVDHPDSNTLNFDRNLQGVGNAKPNVVLVICESFSMYKSSMGNNPLNTTPYFNQLCNDGIFFDHCFSPAYGTARGVWATLTGIPDVELNNTSSRNPAAVDQHILINDFKDYDHYYFLGGSASWANIRGLLSNNIQDLHIYEEGSYDAKSIDVWGISDKHLFLEADKVLGQNKKPFFAVIQTADNHRPYTIPTEDIGAFQRKKVSIDSLKKFGFESEDEYNAFRYTDFCYQQFIESVKKQPYFDNTIFVFVGDHGIHGDASNMLPKAFTEQSLTNMHIPLLFYSPKLLQPKKYNNVCSQIDILPTVSKLCNVKGKNTALGRDLLDEKNKSNYAFLFFVEDKIIGVVNDEYCYRRQLVNANKENFEGMKDSNVATNDSAKQAMHKIADAFYETSRYMLLANKKQKN
jgi:phosphoglycerol transferase MdoB-like AlkP superfamily enzyme